MAPNLFRFLLAIVALYAFLQGRRDERQMGLAQAVKVWLEPRREQQREPPQGPLQAP